MGDLSVNSTTPGATGASRDWPLDSTGPRERSLPEADYAAAGGATEDAYLLRTLYDRGPSFRRTLAADIADKRAAGRTTPEDLLPVPGGDRVSRAFKEKVIRIAAQLGTDPNFLMAIMSFESGGTFSPSVRNAAGSGATGLIQFMPSTARALGTTTDRLARMSAVEQLDYVAKYFAPYRGRLGQLEDAYMAVLYPAAIGRGGDYVLFRRGTTAYRQNSGLDLNRDGAVTAREAAAPVRARLGRPAPGGGGAHTYTVRPGDTLSGIAARHHTTWQALARLNRLPNPDVIHPGQLLKLPR